MHLLNSVLLERTIMQYCKIHMVSAICLLTVLDHMPKNVKQYRIYLLSSSSPEQTTARCPTIITDDSKNLILLYSIQI